MATFLWDYDPRTERYRCARSALIDLSGDGLVGYEGSARQGDGAAVLSRSGLLLIQEGFECDGPSGPTVDTTAFLQGAGVHDALYALLRAGVLPQATRPIADRVMRRLNRAYGMGAFRAWYTYQAVRLFGGASARPSSR